MDFPQMGCLPAGACDHNEPCATHPKSFPRQVLEAVADARRVVATNAAASGGCRKVVVVALAMPLGFVGKPLVDFRNAGLFTLTAKGQKLLEAPLPMLVMPHGLIVPQAIDPTDFEALDASIEIVTSSWLTQAPAPPPAWPKGDIVAIVFDDFGVPYNVPVRRLP